MRKIINSTYVTLDGVIQDPQDWPALGSFSNDGNTIQTDLLLSCDAVLMGRHTYDSFVPVWAPRSGDPYTDHMNAITKYVVSTSLTEPEWANTTVIHHDPIETIRDLKQQPGANIVQYGSVPPARPPGQCGSAGHHLRQHFRRDTPWTRRALTMLCGIGGVLIGYYLAAALGVDETRGIDWIRWIISIIDAAILVVIAATVSGRRTGRRI